MQRYVFKSIKRSCAIGTYHFNMEGTLNAARLHAHAREEIHLLVSGEAAYEVGACKFRMRRGDLLYIPRYTLHALHAVQPETKFYVLDGSMDLTGVLKAHVPEPVMEVIIQAGKDAQSQGNPEGMIPWINYLLTLLKPDAFVSVESRTEDAATLLRYISENYQREITLSDAAREAKLSQRQAQRLIKKETGLTFLEELTRQRMDVAGYLMDQGKMSLEEIAQYVGYRSYSGFWKAWQRHKKAESEGKYTAKGNPTEKKE